MKTATLFEPVAWEPDFNIQLRRVNRAHRPPYPVCLGCACKIMTKCSRTIPMFPAIKNRRAGGLGKPIQHPLNIQTLLRHSSPRKERLNSYPTIRRNSSLMAQLNYSGLCPPDWRGLRPQACWGARREYWS